MSASNELKKVERTIGFIGAGQVWNIADKVWVILWLLITLSTFMLWV